MIQDTIIETITEKPTYQMLEQQVAALRGELSGAMNKLTEALFQLGEMRRLVFGAKSERFVPGTPLSTVPTLFDLPDTVIPPVETIQKTVTVTLAAKKKNEDHPGRKPLPEHLVREETILEPMEDVSGLRIIGQDITETLDYTPGRLFVRRYVRNKYAKPKSEGVLVAPLPEQPITRGMCTSALLTHIIISKFVDGMPIYRLLEIFKREGVTLSPATVSGWLESAARLMEPLYENLQKQVLASPYLQVDETRLQVLDGKEKGKSHRGWLWGYHSPHAGLVMFDYDPSRNGTNPTHHLKHFKGYLGTDGYQVYDDFAAMTGIIQACCWAHARRKFFEAKDNDTVRASYVLGEIGKLYDLERDIKTLSQEKRLEKRQETAVPILKDLHRWIQDTYAKVLPQSPFGKALAYSLNRWHQLLIYTTSGMVEIDSNLMENAIRPIAVGRKNYLFAGSHDGAKRIAMMYSFMGSCKKNDVEPFAWLRNLFDIIPSWPANRLHELLPNYRPQRN